MFEAIPKQEASTIAYNEALHLQKFMETPPLLVLNALDYIMYSTE